MNIAIRGFMALGKAVCGMNFSWMMKLWKSDSYENDGIGTWY